MKGFLLSLLVLCLPSVVLAAGPYDGSYAVVETGTGPYSSTESYYVVVLQNDVTIGLAILRPSYGVWSYGIGELGGDGVVRGTLYYPDNSAYGTFTARLDGGQFIASVYDYAGATTEVRGAKFF